MFFLMASWWVWTVKMLSIEWVSGTWSGDLPMNSRWWSFPIRHMRGSHPTYRQSSNFHLSSPPRPILFSRKSNRKSCASHLIHSLDSLHLVPRQHISTAPLQIFHWSSPPWTFVLPSNWVNTRCSPNHYHHWLAWSWLKWIDTTASDHDPSPRWRDFLFPFFLLFSWYSFSLVLFSSTWFFLFPSWSWRNKICFFLSASYRMMRQINGKMEKKMTILRR